MSEGPLLVVEEAHMGDGGPNLLQSDPQCSEGPHERARMLHRLCELQACEDPSHYRPTGREDGI
jgi:hypothetical protein